MLCPQCQSSGRATARIDGTKVILNFELMNMNPGEFAEYVEEHRNEGAPPLNPPKGWKSCHCNFRSLPLFGESKGAFLYTTR